MEMKINGLSKKDLEEIEKYKEENGITSDPDNIVPNEDIHTVPLKEDE